MKVQVAQEVFKEECTRVHCEQLGACAGPEWFRSSLTTTHCVGAHKIEGPILCCGTGVEVRTAIRALRRGDVLLLGPRYGLVMVAGVL